MSDLQVARTKMLHLRLESHEQPGRLNLPRLPDEIMKSNSCSNGSYSYMNDVSLSDLPIYIIIIIKNDTESGAYILISETKKHDCCFKSKCLGVSQARTHKAPYTLSIAG